MGKIFERTENGVTTRVPVRDGLAEANHAMMDGKRDVKTMSAGSGRYDITYKDGRRVALVLVDEPEPADEPREWRGTHSNHVNLHRFNETGRARCNRRIHPAYCTPTDKPTEFRTKSEVLSGEHADLYTFCPRCDAK